MSPVSRDTTPTAATPSAAASSAPAPRRMRADARDNLDALVEAARTVFAESGVNAPVRSIAERAGVGVGTLYRHFPLRSDLIAAVFRRELDACVDAAVDIQTAFGPGEALDRWIMRFTQFVATKQGLAAALHSGDAAYEPLAAAFSTRLVPTLDRLLDAAVESGDVTVRVEADEFLGAVANLCHGTGPVAQASGREERMVRLLLAGLRIPVADRRE